MIYSFGKIMAATALVATIGGFIEAKDGQCCPPEPCCSECCGRFVVEADLLYLRAFEGGLSCPCDSTEITDSIEDGVLVSRLEGKAHDPDFKWNLGWRVGAWYEFADRCYDIGAYWTHYDSKSSGGGDQNRLHFDVDFEVVDLLCRSDYAYSSCLSFTPYAGLRYARIDQKLHSHFLSTVDGVVETAYVKAKEDFVGIGPLFGVEADWNVGCGFSLYGNVSLGVLYGTFHVRSYQRDIFTTGTNIDFLKQNTQACQAVVDAGFGIRWQTCFCDDRRLVLQLGLEQHRYFNHNQFFDYGDLSLDGVSLAASIEF